MAFEGEDTEFEQRSSLPVDMKAYTLQNLMKREQSWRPYGNYRVFCRGCILIGPVRSWWWLLEMFTLIVTITFAIEYEKYSLGVWIAGLFMYLVVFASSWKTLLCDPGIMKKPSFSEALRNAKDAAARLPHGSLAGAQMDKYSALGEPIRHTYCFRCHVWRPPGAGHCSICGCCQLKWDHHCPIFGGCVAKNNIIAFYFMTISIPIYVTYLLIMSCFAGAYWYRNGRTDSMFKASFVLDEILVGILLAFILPPVLSQLPCEDQIQDPPPDNRLKNDAIVQMLVQEGQNRRPPYGNIMGAPRHQMMSSDEESSF